MTHFGLLNPPTPGHLNPMISLGRELRRRGHRVTAFNILDTQPKVLAAGLNFCPLAESEYPAGTTAQAFAKLGKLSGFAALRYTTSRVQQAAAMLLQYGPTALKEAGVEALLVDQGTSAGGTVAEFLNIPFINICNALPFNQEDSVPPFFTPWRYNTALWTRLRNRIGYSMFNWLTQPTRKLISEYRQQWKLPSYSLHNDPYSKLAILSQLPAELEFPRTALPEYFHFTGPFHDSSYQEQESSGFPFEKLTGQPLIYASMGTLQNRQQQIFQCIAEACMGLNAQLVISLGYSINWESLQELPGSPLVVEYAPQLELLKKASLTITHAGINTVLHSLSNGVPMVAIPITNDQPGVGTRLAWTGAGEVVPLSRLSVRNLRAAIQQVLHHDSYYSAAARLQQSIYRSGGVKQAANIIEQAITTSPAIRI